MSNTTPNSSDPSRGESRPVFVVIAAYNEAPALGEVLRGLSDHVPLRRVVVVDDGSTDGSGDVALAAGAAVVRHVINRGQGAALATGIAAALRLGAAVVVTFDADGQHDPADIPALVAPVLAGQAQVALGSRFLAGGAALIPWKRRVILFLATWFTRLSTRLRITDTHNGFRALSAEAAAAIRIRHDRMDHASEILEQIKRLNLSYVERPVKVRYSDYSLGKGQRNRDALKMFFKVLLNKVAN